MFNVWWSRASVASPNSWGSGGRCESPGKIFLKYDEFETILRLLADLFMIFFAGK